MSLSIGGSRATLIVSTLFLFLLVAGCAEVQPTPIPNATSIFLNPAPDDFFFRGVTLYFVHCDICHGGQSGETTGPARAHNQDGTVWQLADRQMKSVIREGSLSDKGLMPRFADLLTDEDIVEIVAVMKTWWTPEQRQAQAATTRAYEESLSSPGTGR